MYGELLSFPKPTSLEDSVVLALSHFLLTQSAFTILLLISLGPVHSFSFIS